MDERGYTEPPSPAELAAQQIANLAARVAELERHVAGLRGFPVGAPAPARPIPSAAPPPPPLPPPPLLAPVLTAPAADSPVAGARAKDRQSLENRLGSQVFNRIGIIALLIGATWFLKLAMDNHLIGPLGRVLIGLLAGAGLVVWSERFRRRGFPAFSYSLKAIGSGVLYLSLWAAFHLYSLLPAGAALLGMIAVTGWIAYMAWTQDAEMLAAYALAGGFSTPALLSSGGNHERFLFTYLLAIDIAMVLLVRLKRWPRLLTGALPATAGYFAGWYARHYTTDALSITAVFIAAFFVTFVFASVLPVGAAAPPEAAPGASAWRASRLSLIPNVLVPLGNAAFASLAMYTLLQDSGLHNLLPWIMVVFAAIYLGLLRLPQAAITYAVHLSLAVVFLTVAIPLKASGHWITVGWLVEGTVLLWLSTRFSAAVSSSEQTESPETWRALRLLASGALLLGFFGVFWQMISIFPFSDPAFFNHRFATALVGIAAFGGAAWIALQPRASPDTGWPAYRQIAGASVIALNLIAVFATVTEIQRSFKSSDSASDPGLQSALAISAFLMLYGAALLAVGFWRRSAFVRWQALILLVFTIGKTFLYDTRNLSKGYRGVSFLGLGALLMAVSFAYQKDWLSLREAVPAPPPDEAPR